MKILSVGIVLGALFTLTPAASPDNYNAEVASKYNNIIAKWMQYQLLLYNDTTVSYYTMYAESACYDYKGNAYKPGETYIEFKGGRTWWVSSMWSKDTNYFLQLYYSTCSLAGLPDCAQIAQDGCNICHLQAVTGPCRAFLLRWYYDVDARNCEQFVYGGCQGNKNRFLTYKGCMNKCEGQ